MIVDWGRSAYQTKVRFFRDNPHESPVTFYFAAPGAELLKIPNRFDTRLWIDPRDRPDTIGEVPLNRNTWYRGTDHWAYPGTCRLGTDDEWASGLTWDRTSQPKPPRPLCCTPWGQFWPFAVGWTDEIQAGSNNEADFPMVVSWTEDIQSGSNNAVEFAIATSWTDVVESGSNNADEFGIATSWTDVVEAGSNNADGFGMAVSWTENIQAGSNNADEFGVATSWTADVLAGDIDDDDFGMAVSWTATVLDGDIDDDDFGMAVDWTADVTSNANYEDEFETAISWTADVTANANYDDDFATAISWTADVTANANYEDDFETAVSWTADVESSDDDDPPAVPCPYCDDVPASWTITVSGIGAGAYGETECSRLNGTIEMADFYGPGEEGTTCTWYSDPIASDLTDSAWYWVFTLVSDGFGETPPVYWHLSVQRWSISGGVLLEIPAVYWNYEPIEPCDITQTVDLQDTFGQCEGFPSSIDVDPVTS